MQRKINVAAIPIWNAGSVMNDPSSANLAPGFGKVMMHRIASLAKKWERLSCAAVYAEAGEFEFAGRILEEGKASDQH